VSTDDTPRDPHQRCGETGKCPCWTAGVLAEAAARKPRPQARELLDYIRALSEHRPDWDDTDLARAAAEVFVR
jgi:hypothetical protein